MKLAMKTFTTIINGDRNYREIKESIRTMKSEKINNNLKSQV